MQKKISFAVILCIMFIVSYAQQNQTNPQRQTRDTVPPPGQQPPGQQPPGQQPPGQQPGSGQSQIGQPLNGVTFGFAAGYSILHDDLKEWTLSTDDKYTLQQQMLSRNSFVISSVVTIKLGKLSVDQSTNRLVKQTKTQTPAEQQKQVPQETDYLKDFFSRFSINASLDLVNVKSGDVSFNKSINGGLGLGFFLTDNVQLALFYDIQTFRQLRDNVVTTYLGKGIPKGTGIYNALDPADNSLFYNKTITGTSFKIILSLANKKSS